MRFLNPHFPFYQTNPAQTSSPALLQPYAPTSKEKAFPTCRYALPAWAYIPSDAVLEEYNYHHEAEALAARQQLD
jgi:hypothetical protein